MSESDRAVVQKFFDCIEDQDIEGCMSLMGPDCWVSEADGVPFSGTYRGPEGFEELFRRITSQFVPTLSDVGVHAAGEFVIARMNGTFESISNGRSITMPITEAYWVTDGKISRIDVYYKNPRGLDQLTTG